MTFKVANCTSVDFPATDIRIDAMKGLDELAVLDSDFIANAPPFGWRGFDPRTPLKPLAAKLLVVGMGWRR